MSIKGSIAKLFHWQPKLNELIPVDDAAAHGDCPVEDDEDDAEAASPPVPVLLDLVSLEIQFLLLLLLLLNSSIRRLPHCCWDIRYPMSAGMLLIESPSEFWLIEANKSLICCCMALNDRHAASIVESWLLPQQFTDWWEPVKDRLIHTDSVINRASFDLKIEKFWPKKQKFWPFFRRRISQNFRFLGKIFPDQTK